MCECVCLCTWMCEDAFRPLYAQMDAGAFWIQSICLCFISVFQCSLIESRVTDSAWSILYLRDSLLLIQSSFLHRQKDTIYMCKHKCRRTSSHSSTLWRAGLKAWVQALGTVYSCRNYVCMCWNEIKQKQTAPEKTGMPVFGFWCERSCEQQTHMCLSARNAVCLHVDDCFVTHGEKRSRHLTINTDVLIMSEASWSRCHSGEVRGFPHRVSKQHRTQYQHSDTPPTWICELELLLAWTVTQDTDESFHSQSSFV